MCYNIWFCWFFQISKPEKLCNFWNFSPVIFTLIFTKNDDSIIVTVLASATGGREHLLLPGTKPPTNCSMESTYYLKSARNTNILKGIAIIRD